MFMYFIIYYNAFHSTVPMEMGTPKLGLDTGVSRSKSMTPCAVMVSEMIYHH